jgi:hypothetical protein
VATPGPHSSYFEALAGTVHSICPPRRSLVPITFKDTLTVTASTGLLKMTLTVPPQKPTGFPLESTVGHSDRGTPVAPLAGLIETTAKGPGLELGDCEPQPTTQSDKITTVIINLVATGWSLARNRHKFNSNNLATSCDHGPDRVATDVSVGHIPIRGLIGTWATHGEPDDSQFVVVKAVSRNLRDGVIP